MTLCGYRTGMIQDQSRANWQNTSDRPIAWSAWYPTGEAAQADRPEPNFFDLGDVIWEAPLPPNGTFPVVLLSHGTGGTAESLGWLARALACNGYVVLGANHHGNTGAAPYHAAGFLCWWERATDLSVLLSSVGQTGVFANRLNTDHVTAAGFSLGAYTVLALLGAQTSLRAFDAWRMTHGISQNGPKEFPNAADNIPELMDSSQAFRTSWARHQSNFSDVRITSAVAIAPPTPVRAFEPASLARIQRPVTIITGGADDEAPAEHCVDWLNSHNNRFVHHDLGPHVGHYTFLDLPSDRGLVEQLDIFSDHESVDRPSIHRQTIDLVLQSLGPTANRRDV